MATGGHTEAGWKLVNVTTLTLENSNVNPVFNSIVVYQGKIIIIDRNACQVQLYRLNDGKLLATADGLYSVPRDMCLIDDMAICLMYDSGLIEIMSIDCTAMVPFLETTRMLLLQEIMDRYFGVVRLKDYLVVSGEKQGMLCWFLVSLLDGHVDMIHQICKVNGWRSQSRVATKDNIIYISCRGDNTGVYGFDILNPSQCRYTYKNQRLRWPTSIVINEGGNVFVCDNTYHKEVGVYDYVSCIHQLTDSCHLLAIFTYPEEILRNPFAIFWDNGCLYVACLGSNDIGVFTPLYQDNSGVYGYDILNPSQCRYTYKHQPQSLPISIITNEDRKIIVGNNLIPESCVHQLTGSCQLVAISTQGIPRNLSAILLDNGRLYVRSYVGHDITAFSTVYQGSHKTSESLVKYGRKPPAIEEIITQTGQGNDQCDDGNVSPLTSKTVERELFSRISCLIVDIGTKVLRRLLIFYTVSPNFTFAQFLTNKENYLRNNNFLSSPQLEEIFPKQGTTDQRKYDISLTSALLLTLVPKLDPQIGQAVRYIRRARNKYQAHTASARMKSSEFTTQWTEITDKLIYLSHCCHDPDFEDQIIEEIKEIKESAAAFIKQNK